MAATSSATDELFFSLLGFFCSFLELLILLHWSWWFPFSRLFRTQYSISLAKAAPISADVAHLYLMTRPRFNYFVAMCGLGRAFKRPRSEFFDWNSLEFLMRRIITQRAESQPTTTQSVSGSGIEFGSRFHLGSRRDDYYFPFVTDGQLCCSIRQGKSLLLQVLTCSDDLSKFQWPT